jgi:dTDP-4-amino-4,6-dideoxygalactose transaminase
MIPILDLVQQYRSLKPEIDDAVAGVLQNGCFIMGPNVSAFEEEVAGYLGAPHAIALNSGTDALHLSLRALNIGPGDEVITSPFTFVATTEAICIVGATPVFVDIDPATYNLDPALIEAAITPRTKAILPIHLYGNPADLEAIVSIAKRRALAVIEDCAQAIGAETNGRKVGTIGDIGCYSFFPTKNLGAYGDGGLLTTGDRKIADRVRGLRAHGGSRKYYHEELGINSRLDEIQAAILRVKLPHLPSWTAARRSIATRYSSALEGCPGVLATPAEQEGRMHVYHQYTIRVSNRDSVRKRLADAGVQTMVYYPLPLHQQRLHASLKAAVQSFPHSERAAREVLSLPMYPELTSASQDEVIHSLWAAANVDPAA